MQIVLVKIYYENHKSVLITTLSEVESIGLTIMTTNVLPFTTSSLDITIMATAGEDFSLSVRRNRPPWRSSEVSGRTTDFKKTQPAPRPHQEDHEGRRGRPHDHHRGTRRLRAASLAILFELS